MTTKSPREETAKHHTSAWCPSRVNSSSNLSASQYLTTLSLPAQRVKLVLSRTDLSGTSKLHRLSNMSLQPSHVLRCTQPHFGPPRGRQLLQREAFVTEVQQRVPWAVCRGSMQDRARLEGALLGSTGSRCLGGTLMISLWRHGQAEVCNSSHWFPAFPGPVLQAAAVLSLPQLKARPLQIRQAIWTTCYLGHVNSCCTNSYTTEPSRGTHQR